MMAKMNSIVANLLCVLQCGVLAMAFLDPVDFLALQSIQKSLHDLPGSSFFTSWDFTGDPCSFDGVYCDGDKVDVLYLGDPTAGSPGLTGRLASEIGNLSALTEFTLVPGRVFGTLPESISQLTKLRSLQISRNFISGEIPESLGELQKLKTLDLSFNQLNGTIPSSIGALPELSNVVLCNNQFSGQIPPFRSQTLTILDLNHNILSGNIGLDSLLPSSLEYLSLSWNLLEGPVDRLLTGLNRLNYLDLCKNQFSGTIPAILFTFPITNLQLQRNNFTGRVQPANQVTISTVDLSYNRLYGEISPMLAGVENLYLNTNRFTGQVPTIFVDRLLAADTKTLYLQHNFLSGIEINPMAEIPVTSSLCLQYNCMVLPLQTPCPLKAGNDKVRPISQCPQVG